jgi:hypothetical protein
MPPSFIDPSPRGASGSPANSWDRVVAAARAVSRSAESGQEETAPFGFSTKVTALWRHARDEDRRLALWQRVSWRAAAMSVVLCAAMAWTQRGNFAAPAEPLVEPPAFAFPSF